MTNKVLCLLLLVYINNDFCLSLDDVPIVETSLGKITGLWKISNNGREYAAFEGIPYAKPPIGELRFEDPQPVGPWSGVLNAVKPHVCPQDHFFNIEKIQGEEDCLYLNVYVPDDIDPEGKYDVLVHIHGGAFRVGSGHMMVSPKLILDKDLILVSFNYRLGILGFLSTEDDAIPGNYGLKDQVLALRWIKDNIASFGGNPDSVTITGISSGAASVHLHYFSPLSKGLFARGLSQSGTALNPWAIKKNPLENAKKLAALLDCPDKTTSELKQCLKKKPAELFVEKYGQLVFDNDSLSAPFAPVIEKGAANPFLTKDPYLLLKEKKVQDLPWITSTTSEEGLISTSPRALELEKVDFDWPRVAHIILDYNYTLPESKREEVAKKIKDFYLGAEEHINQDNFKQFTQIFTDRLFVIGAEIAAKLQSRANKSPVYYYLFNYKDGQYKMAQVYYKNKDAEGVAHGDDIFYFYKSLFSKSALESDIELKNACQRMLYLYATTGNASFDGTDSWKPTTDLKLTYLNITGPKNMKLQTTKHLAPLEFWSSLGILENKNLVFKDEL